MSRVERVLLLLPTSTYRTKDFLEAADSLGVEVVVGSEEPSALESSKPDRLITLDFLDPEAAAAHARKFHHQFPIDAVVPVDEETAVAAASIAAALGFPHNSPEAAVRSRLKHRMREALAGGRRSSAVVHRRENRRRPEASLARAHLSSGLEAGFSLRKPGRRSRRRRESFIRGFEWLSAFLSRPEMRAHAGEEGSAVLIEEYVDGREVALEGILTEGKLRPLALFDKPDPLVGPFSRRRST